MRVQPLSGLACIPANHSTTDLIPFSAALDIKTSSGGLHITALKLYKTLIDQKSQYATKLLGITVFCRGTKMPLSAFLWEHDGTVNDVLTLPPLFFARVTQVQLQTLLDMAIDLTPLEKLRQEEAFYGDEVTELSSRERECAAKLERLQHQRYKCGSMAKLLNEPTMEIDALEEKAHELHNERMLLTSRWYLLQIASERRSMSATERIAEAERIRQRSPSAFPRA
jgi:hypothetical protein